MSRTTLKVVSILETIANAKDGITLTEIAKKNDIPKSTTHTILQSLEKTKMIYICDKSRTKYAIGYRSFTIGKRYEVSSQFLNSAQKYVEQLSEKLGKTVYLVKLYNNAAYCIYKKEINNEILKSVDVGDTLPLYCTAIGKVLLANAEPSENQIETITLTKLTEKTITDKSILLDELSTIKNQGYALEVAEMDNLLYSIAAPVFNFEGKRSGAVSFIALINNQTDFQEEIYQVVECARKISKEMGFNQ